MSEPSLQPPPPIQVDAPPPEADDADGSGPLTSNSVRPSRTHSDRNLLSPEDARLGSRRRMSLESPLGGAGPLPQAALPPPSLTKRATILHRQTALYNSTSRTHGMFTGNAAHDISRTTSISPQQHNTATMTAAHFGVGHPATSAGGVGPNPNPATAETPWEMRRRSSAPFGYGMRTTSLMATPADYVFGGPDDNRLSQETLTVVAPALPQPSQATARRATGINAQAPGGGPDSTEEDTPSTFADIPMSITVADFSHADVEEEADVAPLPGGDGKPPSSRRPRAQSTQRHSSGLSTAQSNPFVVPSLSRHASLHAGSPLGDPGLAPTPIAGSAGSRTLHRTPSAAAIAGERLLSARRNRSFGGFDDQQDLIKEISSDEASSGGTPRVEALQLLLGRSEPSRTVPSPHNAPLPRGLSMNAFKQQHSRSFRRQSYASPEAMINRCGSASYDCTVPTAPRKRSKGGRPDVTPYEAFQRALDKAVDSGDALAAASRRRGTLLMHDARFDFEHVFGDGDLAAGPHEDSADYGTRRGSAPNKSETAIDDDDEYDKGSTGSSSRHNSFTQRGTRNTQLKDLLISSSGQDDGVAHWRQNTAAHGGDGLDAQERAKRKARERSEVEMHLYRSSLNAIPLPFVVQEVHNRIHRDRMYLDLIYYIPFVVLFTVYFLGRDIEDNFFATANINKTNTIRPTFAKSVNVLNEFFRMDTQANDGNQATYMSDDGTDLLDNYFGPQNWRIAERVKLPEVYNVMDVRSKSQAFHWLEHVLVPSLWDCQNPDFQSTDLTNIGGNTVLIGAARIRSVRVRDSCEPNAELWGKRGHTADTWDLGCYGSVSEDLVDSTSYCNRENPAFGSAKAYAARREQTTAVSQASTASASSTSVGAMNETLFPFLTCALTSTTAISEQTTVDLRHPCSGHYMTLPFQASCNNVLAAIDILRPALMDPVVRPEEETSEVLRHMYERFNTRVPSNSCSAFLFHHSVRVFVVEYFSYSVSTDSFFRSRMILEMVDGGATIPNQSVRMFRVWTTSSLFHVLLQGVVLMFVFNFAYRMLSDWSTSKKLSGSYFTFLKDPWNIMDIANNTALLASSILTALWWSASYGTTVQFNRNPQYPNALEGIEELFTMQVYCNAVNVVMIYLKVLKFLRINDRLGIMTKTLGECQQDIVSLLLLFLFIHTGFAIMATSAYGSQLYEFRSVDEAFVRLLLSLLIGADYDAMRRVQPTLTPLFYWMFIVTEIFLLLNFFIAILGEGFAQVNQSMHLPTLDMALLRFVDEVRMVFRWSYIRESLVALTGKKKKHHIKALVEMHACLEEHLRLSMLAVEDLRSLSREHVPMHFRDMEWWLPKGIYDALGTQYLLILWEDMLYAYNIKERLNSKTGERADFARAVQAGVKDVSESFPDVLSLEVQAEVIFDKLEKLPLKIVEWSIAQQQNATRLAQMTDKERRLARKQSEMQRRRSSFASAQQQSAAGDARAARVQNETDALLAQLSRPATL